MKINIEVEMTPEEARRTIGLPDLAPMQEELVAQIADQLKRNVAYIDPELLVKSVLPVGVEGIDKMQKLLWAVAKSAVGNGGAEPAAKAAKRPRKRS